MSARTFCRFVMLPLLVSEVLAFSTGQKPLGIFIGLFALCALGLFWARGPQAAEDREPCPPNCRKCAEDSATAADDPDEEFDSFAWRHGDLDDTEGER